MSEQRQMQQYLEDKYGEEFVVKEPIRKAGGLGIEGFLESEAYPVKDNSLIFPIRMASTFKNDEYAGVLWQREESKRIEPESRRIFGEDVSLGIEIKTTGTSRGDINIVGNVSNFNTATNKYGKKILYIVTIINKTHAKIPSDQDKTEIANHILELKRYLPIGKTDVILDYYIIHTPSDNEKYGLSVSGTDLSSITTPEELVSKFKIWGARS